MFTSWLRLELSQNSWGFHYGLLRNVCGAPIIPNLRRSKCMSKTLICKRRLEQLKIFPTCLEKTYSNAGLMVIYQFIMVESVKHRRENKPKNMKTTKNWSINRPTQKCKENRLKRPFWGQIIYALLGPCENPLGSRWMWCWSSKVRRDTSDYLPTVTSL